MELIVSDRDDIGEEYSVAEANFHTVWRAMLTLVQFITFDSVASIYRPLVERRPELMVYFACYFLIGPIALMNIVTAIMVESSLRTANEDQEAKKAWESMKRKRTMPRLAQIFMDLDTNGDGEVDLQELMKAPEEVQDQIKRIVDLEQLEEVFRMLDYDNSGTISIDEFVDGIMKSQQDKPSELFVIVKQCKAILNLLNSADKKGASITS